LSLGKPCSGDAKETLNELKRLSPMRESNTSSCFYIFFTYNSDDAQSEEDFSVPSMSFSHKLLALLACEKNLCSLAIYQYLKDNVLSKRQLREVVA
jgi:hypothetical protein